MDGALFVWRHTTVLLSPYLSLGAAENPPPLAPSLDSSEDCHDC
jgi:hypothetical protein